MLASQFRKHVIDNKLEDRWWVAVDGEVQDDPLRVIDVIVKKAKWAKAEVALLHIDDAKAEESTWRIFEYGSNPTISLQAPEKVHIAADKNEPIPTPRAPEPLPETIDTSAQILSELKAMREEMAAMRNLSCRVDALIDELNCFKETRAQLDERSEFLSRSEDMVFQKLQDVEEERCELEHLRETLENEKIVLMEA